MIDIATKELDPDIAKERSYKKRFDELVAKGLITEDIRQWAHEAKELETKLLMMPPNLRRRTSDELANLTKMTLVYVFELPRQDRGHEGEAL